jgi:hypothetical protein
MAETKLEPLFQSVEIVRYAPGVLQGALQFDIGAGFETTVLLDLEVPPGLTREPAPRLFLSEPGFSAVRIES